MATGSIVLFHGSAQVLRSPELGHGKETNDFGAGFYCTRHKNLAKEWACTESRGGFANLYDLDLSGLRILELTERPADTLRWLALLSAHRVFSVRSETAERGLAWLRDGFAPDEGAYDVIEGCRADDSCFSFAQDFLDGVIPLGRLCEALRLEPQHGQTVLMTDAALDALEFLGYEEAIGAHCFPLRLCRDELLRSRYAALPERRTGELFLSDLIKGGVEADDPRLQ